MCAFVTGVSGYDTGHDIEAGLKSGWRDQIKLLPIKDIKKECSFAVLLVLLKVYFKWHVGGSLSVFVNLQLGQIVALVGCQ